MCFAQGLGDCVMLSAVLQHLHKHHPDWRNTVAASRGRHTAFGLAFDGKGVDVEPMDLIRLAASLNGQTRPGMMSPITRELAATLTGGPWDLIFEHVWPECDQTYSDSPSTKAARCLREVFGIKPEKELLRYKNTIIPERRLRADRYVSSLPRGPFAVVHYEGTSGHQKKAMAPSEVREMCAFLVSR